MKIKKCSQEMIDKFNQGMVQIRIQATPYDIDFFEEILVELGRNGRLEMLSFSKRLNNVGTSKFKREFITATIKKEN